MAIRVPTYDGRQVQAQPLRIARQDPNTSSAAGLVQVGRGLEQAAGVFDELADRERAKAERASLIEADNQVDSWETANLHDAENGALNRRGKAAFDLPNQVLPKFDEESRRIEGTLGTENARLAFRAQSSRRRQQISQGLEQHEARERETFYDEQDTAKIRSSADMAGNYYNDPRRIGQELAKQDAVVDEFGKRKGWSEEQLADAKRANHSGVHADVVNRYLARGEFKKGRIYFDEVKSQITSDAAMRIEATFTAERERVRTEVKQAMNDQLRDINAAAALGLPVAIPSETTLKGIYGEHEGAQRYKVAAQAKELSPRVAQMQQMSEVELQAFVAGQQPKSQEGAADQAQVANFLDQRAGEILRMREKDPAGYLVANAPGSKQAWQRFAGAQTPEERDAAAAEYLKTVRADRERLGITKSDVLPDSYAEEVADRINNPKSGPGLVDDLEQEAARWGGSWDQVYAQLAPKLSDTAAVIGSGIQRNAAVTLAGLSGLKEAELKAMLPPGVSWKDLETEVADKFEDLQRSLPPEAARMNNAFRESATRLAASYAQGGADADDAVARAYQDLIGSQYQMVEYRSVPMRVPNTVDPDAVEAGAGEAIAKYSARASDILVPQGSFRSPEEYADELTNEVRENGYWMTRPDGKGLRLYLDGGPVPDLSSPTRSVDLTWEQLRALNTEVEERSAEQLRKESIKRQMAR